MTLCSCKTLVLRRNVLVMDTTPACMLVSIFLNTWAIYLKTNTEKYPFNFFQNRIFLIVKWGSWSSCIQFRISQYDQFSKSTILRKMMEGPPVPPKNKKGGGHKGLIKDNFYIIYISNIYQNYRMLIYIKNEKIDALKFKGTFPLFILGYKN